ncbi:alpha/beta hydrolase [Massilia sp. KIM]|uniref:alpha/beta fold hydrolase n=1 Tax=Massilia sp. KIM TaxID=1955422 RepID=UPI0009902AAC|nr:alpha/beta hydrolase [Massilia sp. KIM]OON63029.1 alpha/beta hydrolase [Massilia sp. KIM]
MNRLATTLVAAALLSIAAAPLATAAEAGAKPTIVLVHGAFADSSGWDGVAANLTKDGYRVVAAYNPLRGVKNDAEAVASVLRSIPGSVVLVGHSYGGAVITTAALGNENVKSLVYVGGFAPDAGENVLELTTRFPGSTLPAALAAPAQLADGTKDFYIDQDKFHQQFAADLTPAKARLMAIGQRPIAEAALKEATAAAAWKQLPSYFIYGSADKNIPPASLSFMAERAQSRRTVVIKGASHVVMSSHPTAVAQLIRQAAQAK